MFAVPYREAVQQAIKQARHLERLREQLEYKNDIQRDYQRWCGTPLGFTATAVYGVGASPLTFSSAADLASWHLSTRGLVIGATLIKSSVPDPNVAFTTDVNQSVPLRMDVLTGGLRGVATYGLTIDGGLSYFQSGVTATTVPVPLFGQSLTMSLGTFTLGTTYTAVAASMANQTPLVRTLVGGPTDANRPIIRPLAQNGYPCLEGVGGTLGGMLDTTSTWAAEVCNSPSPGVSKDFTWIFAMAPDSAAPSAARAFFSMADNTSANPLYSFTSRNGTNNYRCWHENDAGTVQLREAGALDTNFHCYSVVQSGGNVSAWVDGTVIVNALTWLPATTTTCSNAALFVNSRGGTGQTSVGRHRFLELVTYRTALSTLMRQQVEVYLKGKYALP